MKVYSSLVVRWAKGNPKTKKNNQNKMRPLAMFSIAGIFGYPNIIAGILGGTKNPCGNFQRGGRGQKPMHDMLFGGSVISRHTYDIYDTLRRLYFTLTTLYDTLRTQHKMIPRWSQHARSCVMESLFWFKLCGMVMLLRR